MSGLSWTADLKESKKLIQVMMFLLNFCNSNLGKRILAAGIKAEVTAVGSVTPAAVAEVAAIGLRKTSIHLQ